LKARALQNKTAIVGIGCTDFSRDSGRSEYQLALEAAVAACRDAGISPHEIDCITLSSYQSETVDEAELLNGLGMKNLSYLGLVGHGGGAGCAVVGHAALAIATGMAETALCLRALNSRSEFRYGQFDKNRGDENLEAPVPWFYAYLHPYGFFTPAQWAAFWARRHMHEYGTTAEHFGAIAVAARKHAARNPAARFYQQPITMQDYLDCRMVVDPLRLFDCCLETDGACAVIVTSAERARDLAQRPAYIRAMAQGTGGRELFPITAFNRERITGMEETARMGDFLFAMADLRRADIDVAELYDHFGPLVLLSLEDLGFCARGEGGPFVEGGRIELGGELPINTHGGLVAEAYVHGFNHIVEGVRQVRGTSTAQVEGAEHVLVTSADGVPTSGLILSRST
jgi:17-hydroxy-3-oxo-4-pregnene-20-carboxyl-CoA lyase